MQPAPRRMPSGFSGQLTSSQAPGLFSPTGFSNMPLTSPSMEHHPADAQRSEVNTARLCRIGQELVHEILQKAADVFQLMKSTHVSTIWQGVFYLSREYFIWSKLHADSNFYSYKNHHGLAVSTLHLYGLYDERGLFFVSELGSK